MRRPAAARERGLTLIEVLIASLILLIVITGFLAFQAGAWRKSEEVNERTFAIARAASILEELEAYVEGGSESHAELLDDFDDGKGTSPLLTTLREITEPDDPVSGNRRRDDGSWMFSRRVNVSKLQGIESRDVRLVQVTVFRSLEGEPAGRVLVQVSRVVRTIGSYLPPTQVVDVYALALENVPGWWVNMATIRPLVENAFGDMEAVNPGLEFRLHWITRLAYGRDEYYRPYVNMDHPASERVPFVYWYPGLIDESGFVYYSATRMGGRINVDGQHLNDASSAPYSLADQFNHALRYPDERALYEQRKRAGLETEPTLRLLLDEMVMDPDEHRNALIINLHGEMLPLPPVRNYSDPAKDPLRYPNVRAVTHPEKLQLRNYDDLVLRVYAFSTRPDATPDNAVFEDPIIVRLKGIQAHDSIDITRIDGGAGRPYRKVKAKDARITFDGSDTIIELPNTPLRHSQVGPRGLAKSARLYGWEYIPSPVEAEADFSTDLTSPGDGPKNTARWIIRLPGDVVPDGRRLTFETRLGQPPTGTGVEDSFAVSRTYAWVGSEPPPSEKYQFLGDPRHNPYADVKRRHGYNWWFHSAGDYEGFDRATDGWAVDKVDVDVPRYFALWREALVSADTIFTTMNGFSFFYVGIGGELGSDEPNGYPDGLPLNDLPYGGSGSKTVFVSEIHHAMRVPAARRTRWFARYWLGELFPDSQYGAWRKDGNLPTGPSGFTRKECAKLTGFDFDRRKRTDRYGASSFFNAVGDGTGPFNHLFQNKNVARATTDGQLLGTSFNLNTPASMSAYRPFELDAGINYPPEWKRPEYAKSRLHSRVRRVLYDADHPRSASSSSLMEVENSGEGHSAFFVMNGLSPAGVSGTAFMGRYAAITLMQGYMIAGEGPKRPSRVAQLPRVEIVAPSEDAELIDPSTIDVRWDTTWRRWDGARYTPYYPEKFTESVPVYYAVMYSFDGGRTWRYTGDDQIAHPGQRPLQTSLVGDTHVAWNVADKPAGDFLLRVEAYRQGIPLHYAYHVVRQNIRR